MQGSFGKPLFKKSESTSEYVESKTVNVSDTINILQGKKKIAILTGAGISVASGIPTFRGIGAAELF